MWLQVGHRGPGRPGDPGQRAELVEHVRGDLLGREVHVPAAEADQVRVRDLRTDHDPARGGRGDRAQQGERVAGVEAAGDVGAGHHVQDRLVVAQRPGPVRLADVRVQVHCGLVRPGPEDPLVVVGQVGANLLGGAGPAAAACRGWTTSARRRRRRHPAPGARAAPGSAARRGWCGRSGWPACRPPGRPRRRPLRTRPAAPARRTTRPTPPRPRPRALPPGRRRLTPPCQLTRATAPASLPAGAAGFSGHADRAGHLPERSGAESAFRRGQAAQYCACLPITSYGQSAASSSCSTAARLRLVSRPITSSGG